MVIVLMFKTVKFVNHLFDINNLTTFEINNFRDWFLKIKSATPIWNILLFSFYIKYTNCLFK